MNVENIIDFKIKFRELLNLLDFIRQFLPQFYLPI